MSSWLPDGVFRFQLFIFYFLDHNFILFFQATFFYRNTLLPDLFICGSGESINGRFRNLHNGNHPSFILITKRLSGGQFIITFALWASYRELKYYRYIFYANFILHQNFYIFNSNIFLFFYTKILAFLGHFLHQNICFLNQCFWRENWGKLAKMLRIGSKCDKKFSNHQNSRKILNTYIAISFTDGFSRS